MLIVGSAKIGISIAPHKFPKPFDVNSDIDVAIASDEWFDIAWRTVLRWQYRKRHGLGGHDLRFFEQAREQLFEGWIDLTRLRFNKLIFPKLLNPLRQQSAQWFAAFQELSTIDGLEYRVVNGRLYRTIQHLRDYQEHSLRKLASRRRKESNAN